MRNWTDIKQRIDSNSALADKVEKRKACELQKAQSCEQRLHTESWGGFYNMQMHNELWLAGFVVDDEQQARNHNNQIVMLKPIPKDCLRPKYIIPKRSGVLKPKKSFLKNLFTI